MCLLAIWTLYDVEMYSNVLRYMKHTWEKHASILRSQMCSIALDTLRDLFIKPTRSYQAQSTNAWSFIARFATRLRRAAVLS